jgi:hypothetical protein
MYMFEELGSEMRPHCRPASHSPAVLPPLDALRLLSPSAAGLFRVLLPMSKIGPKWQLRWYEISWVNLTSRARAGSGAKPKSPASRR